MFIPGMLAAHSGMQIGHTRLLALTAKRQVGSKVAGSALCLSGHTEMKGVWSLCMQVTLTHMFGFVSNMLPDTIPGGFLGESPGSVV